LSQKYTLALSQSNAMSQDLIHCLFPNLNKLLNFQRKFLMRLESTAELPWQDQRWGLHFIENVRFIVFYHDKFTDYGHHPVVLVVPSGTKEEEFEVYEQYCANYDYKNASDIMVANESSLLVRSASNFCNPDTYLHSHSTTSSTPSLNYLHST
jgi:cell division control protein 24